MRLYLLAYLTSTLCFALLDFTWLSLTINPIYKPQMASLLLDKPNWIAIVSFYLLYGVGIAAFAIIPSLLTANWLQIFAKGALLGLIAYGAYDLTNLATLKSWPLPMSLIDMAWGTVGSGLAASIAVFILRHITSVK